MSIQSEKWLKGYNDGYVLGTNNTFIAKIIFSAVESSKLEYGKGLRLGYHIAREHDQKKRMGDLGKLRDKGKDHDQGQERE